MDYIGKLQQYLNEEIRIIQSLDLNLVNTVMNILEEARLSNKNIYICGNGGSAATASHFCCDFNKGISEKQEQKYRFKCLSDNVPVMTAIANDISYEEIFRFQLKNEMSPKDIFIGISGSGNSKNVINAMEYAKEIGGVTIAVVGYNGGKMKDIADYNIHVNIDNMQISEDVHIILNHMMMYVLSNY
ncbi:MAG: SIS domain-containing protein [Lachnospiraceae bacterium]|nr:SIS domain-containing protein [Lachnospiraceae bacterium]